MFNTMEKKEYVKEHAVWSLICILWFWHLLFKCVPNCTYFESLLVFIVISVTIMGLGIFVTWQKGRNYINLVENIVISWSMFVVVAYMNVLKQRMVRVGILVVVSSLLMTIYILFQRINRRDKRRQVIKKRIRKVFNLWKQNLVLGSLILLISISISVIFNGTILTSTAEVVKVYGDEHCLDANIEVISDIEPTRWKKLEIQEKLNVSQKIVNCEARYLGISHEIRVGTADLDEGTLACYIESKHQIVLDIEYLESSYSYDILESLIHEVTHAYQHELINMYLELDEKTRNLLIFYPVSQYLDEFTNYENGDKNYMLYYGQLAEIDARKAGRTEALVYIERVEEYLGLKETTLEE